MTHVNITRESGYSYVYRTDNDGRLNNRFDCSLTISEDRAKDRSNLLTRWTDASHRWSNDSLLRLLSIFLENFDPTAD